VSVDVETVLRLRLDELASTIGCLRRRVVGDEYAEYLVGRLASLVESLDCIVSPSAGQIYAANLVFCGDEDEAVEAALGDVDDRVRRLRGLLGQAA